MKRYPLLVVMCFISLSVIYSQESSSLPVKTVNHATLFGIGKAHLSDSYLSPLRYSGVSLSLMHDRINGSPYFGGRLLLQQQFQIETSITENPTASASEYYGVINYHLNSFYPIVQRGSFRLMGGAGWDASLGGIYNVRNSNNPGSLKIATNFNLTAMGRYRWRLLTFRWQLTTPFAGMFFSPEYGHSYYEIFTLGNNKGTVHFGSFHNQLSFRNYFTIDIPLRKITLRAGYLNNYYQTAVNDLQTKIVSHQFMIGVAVESINFGGHKVRRNHAIRSVYYD